MKKTLSFALLAMMLITSLPLSAWTSFTVYMDGKLTDGQTVRLPWLCELLYNAAFRINPAVSYGYDEETGEYTEIFDYSKGSLFYRGWDICAFDEDADITFQPALGEVTGMKCSYDGAKLSVSWDAVEGANLYIVYVRDNTGIAILPTKGYTYVSRDLSLETYIELYGDASVVVYPAYLSDEMRANMELLGYDDLDIALHYENVGIESDTFSFTPTVEKPDEATMLNNLGLYWYQQNTFDAGSQRNMNGEPWMCHFFGETIGSDLFDGNFNVSVFQQIVLNDGFFTEGREYWMNQTGWVYPRELILVATQALEMLEEKGWECRQLEAQARAMRATQYLRLLQIFAPRWEDSSNGTVAVLPEFLPKDYYMYGQAGMSISFFFTRTRPGVMDNLKTMNEVKEMIYADLDKAIELMAAAGPIEEAVTQYDTERNYMPIDAMRGIYARTAMLFHDYETARKQAAEARKDHPIMTADEYLDGFAKANSEWIWQLNGHGLYYWQQMAFNGCNGAYVTAWGDYGAGAINYDLYRQMDVNDCRRALFWTPDKGTAADYGNDYDEWLSRWYNEAYVNSYDMCMTRKDADMARSVVRFTENGKLAGASHPDWPKAYGGVFGGEKNIMVPFGAQFKFWGDNIYSHSEVPMMRGAEMLLIEAEAAWELGDEAAACALLDELNRNRIAGYRGSTASGVALRDEIRLARRIELWGEGFSWFDLKRWNLPMSRRPWIAGDTSSNNIPAGAAVTVNPEDNNGWRCVLPACAYYEGYVEQKAAAAGRPVKPEPQPAMQTTPATRPEQPTPMAR